MANQLKEELVLQTNQFDKNINNVIKKVEELRNKSSKVGGGFNSSMTKMIERATGFNGSLGSLVGVVGKFSGALGIAVGAGEAFNKTINGSQTLSDEFGAIQQSVNTIVDDFFQSLANGDFSPFLNGMDNLVSKAREAYNAMDELWNMAQSFSVQNARLNNQFQKNLNEIRAKKESKDPNDQLRVKQLTEQNKQIIKQQAEGGVKLYNQTIKGLQSEIAAGTGMNSKITEGAIYRIVENDINNLKDGRDRYEKQYKEYVKKQDELQKKYSSKKVGGGLIGKVAESLNPTANFGPKYQKELNQLQSQYGEAIAANYLLQRKTDEELGKFNDKLKQGIQYQGVAISNQSKMLRYTKETNKEESNKKGGGKSSKKTVEVVYKEDAKTLKEIQDNISVLNKALQNTVPNSKEYKEISNEIEKWKALIDTTPKITFVEDAKVINDINNNISLLQAKLSNTVKGSQEWLNITKQIKEESAKLRDYQDGSLTDLKNQINDIEEKLSNENLSLKSRLELIDKKTDLQNKIDAISDDAFIKVTPILNDDKRKLNSIDNAKTNINNVLDLFDNGFIDYDKAKHDIDLINKELEKIGAKPVKIHLETDDEKFLSNIETNASKIIGGFQGIDNIISNINSLSYAFENGANAWEVFMGVLNTGMSIINGVSSVMETINTLTEIFGVTQASTAAKTAAAATAEATATQTVAAAETASIPTKTASAVANKALEAATLDLAAAEIFLAHSAIPFAGVGIAGGLVSAMMAAMAAQHTAAMGLQSFANGGIVGGNSFSGDNLLIRANSGEAILTQQHQKRLFQLLDGNHTVNSAGGNVRFIIRGSDLVGTLENYKQIKSKLK